MIFPAINLLVVYPAFTKFLIGTTEDQAIRLARHLESEYLAAENELTRDIQNPALDAKILASIDHFQILKLKIFSPSGEIIYSTNPEDIGTVNENVYFHQVVARGDPYTKLVRKDEQSAEGQSVTLNVVETYVPIMRDGAFIGAFEIYYDITASLLKLDSLIMQFSLLPILLGIGLLGLTVVVAAKMVNVEEELYRMSWAMEQSPHVVMITNTAGRIEYVNRRYTELTGIDRAAIIGQYEPLLSTNNGHSVDTSDVTRSLAATGQWQGERLSQDKDGNDYWESVSVSPIRNADGRVTNMLVMREDITERKRASAAIQLAQEAAEQATRAKSEFLANMSHEIRTPMNAVIGMTSLLLYTDLDEEKREFVETIRASGDTLLTIINDILDFSKIESGKLDLEFAPFSLSTCIEDTLDMFTNQTMQKGIELIYSSADTVPNTIVGDSTRLRQVLTNLLSNAIKFTDHGEVVVSVDGHADDGQWQLHFRVQDTGIGISEEGQQRLFQTFSQVDSSTTRLYGGTGLGLVISRRLSQAMGGDMWVESEEGVGSVFHFTICVKASPDVDPICAFDQSTLTGKRILVVDDNQTNRTILERQLRKWEIEPTTAASGAEALACLDRGEHFDLAIIDMQMPIMDGATLADKLHIHPAWGTGPLVMLSSAGGMAAQLTESPHVFAAILTKPVKQRRLLEALNIIFNGSPGLPVKAPQDSAFPSAQQPARAPLRVLVAEDNRVNQKVALRMIERLGYQADIAANGEEVLNALERQSYDCVFMDVQMPVMDGLEATRWIRANYPQNIQPRIVCDDSARPERRPPGMPGRGHGWLHQQASRAWGTGRRVGFC